MYEIKLLTHYVLQEVRLCLLLRDYIHEWVVTVTGELGTGRLVYTYFTVSVGVIGEYLAPGEPASVNRAMTRLSNGNVADWSCSVQDDNRVNMVAAILICWLYSYFKLRWCPLLMTHKISWLSVIEWSLDNNNYESQRHFWQYRMLRSLHRYRLLFFIPMLLQSKLFTNNFGVKIFNWNLGVV